MLPEYDIRWYRPGDERGIVSLRNAVWDHDVDREWFRWKYRSRSILDHVPIVVAETGGRLVGMRPFVPYRMRDGSETLVGLLHTDTIVHPDHRRQGLFTRMTEMAIDRYRDGEPAFTFGHSNANSRPGYRKMGWREFGPRRWHYRIQAPKECLVGMRGGVAARFAGSTLSPIARLYLGVRDRTVDLPADVTVSRSEGLAVDELAALHQRTQPDALHPVRDEAFYRWYDGDAIADIESTYVARRGGDPVAGVAVLSERGGVDVTTATVTDVEPMTGGKEWLDGLTAIVDRLIDDYRDVAYLKAWDPFPSSVLRPFGFHPIDAPPLSFVTASDEELLHLTARPLGEDSEELVEQRVREGAPYLWSLVGA